MKSDSLWRRARSLTAAAGLGMCVVGLTPRGYAESEGQKLAEQDTQEDKAEDSSQGGAQARQDTSEDNSEAPDQGGAMAQQDTQQDQAEDSSQGGQMAQQDTSQDNSEAPDQGGKLANQDTQQDQSTDPSQGGAMARQDTSEDNSEAPDQGGKLANQDTQQDKTIDLDQGGELSQQDTSQDRRDDPTQGGRLANQDTAQDQSTDPTQGGALARQDTSQDATLDTAGNGNTVPTAAPVPTAKAAAAVGSSIVITQQEALDIGKRIWQNECGGTVNGLTSWNKGEDFASLGIGHFIWFPPGVTAPYQESFPAYLQFAIKQGKTLPGWLKNRPWSSCPWRTRDAFMAAFDSQDMVELRTFLKDTVATQALFAANRMEQALPKMLAAAPADERDAIRKKFYAVASTPGGVYALMDYVNFKGEGTNPKERYQGQGWGLMQVLELMPGGTDQTGNDALANFRKGAVAALTRRVQNSGDRQAQEQKWLPGWTNRIKTYTN